MNRRASARALFFLPLFPTPEGGEGRGEEALSFSEHLSLRLSPRSCLTGRESPLRRSGRFEKRLSSPASFGVGS